MITCNAFLMDLKQHDAAIRKEAYEQGAREEREKVLKELFPKSTGVILALEESLRNGGKP